jgi:prepilin-type processing-associated H-X9-DG protein
LELLVVIGIISLLLALLLPVLSAVRGQARTAACLSNARELSGLFFLRATEHENHLPLAGHVVLPDGTAGFGSLPSVLGDPARSRYAYAAAGPFASSLPTREYLHPAAVTVTRDNFLEGQDAAFLECPEVDTEIGFSFQIALRIDGIDYLTKPPLGMRYAVNAGLLGFDASERGSGRRLRGNIARAREASSMALLGDAVPLDQLRGVQLNAWTPALDGDRATLDDVLDRTSRMWPSPGPDFRHHGSRAIIAFVDGSVAAAEQDKMAQIVLTAD